MLTRLYLAIILVCCFGMANALAAPILRATPGTASNDCMSLTVTMKPLNQYAFGVVAQASKISVITITSAGKTLKKCVSALQCSATWLNSAMASGENSVTAEAVVGADTCKAGITGYVDK